MATTTPPRPVVTAVGRLLKPLHGEPQRWERIRIRRDTKGNVISTEWYEMVEEEPTFSPQL